MHIFSEEQAELLDIKQARHNVVTYSKIVNSQTRQIDFLFKQVEELQKYIYSKDQQLLIKQEQLDEYARLQFGRSSEKRQGPAPLLDGIAAEAATDTPKSDAKPDKPKKKGHGRKEQPKLEVREIIYKLTDQEVKDQNLKAFNGQYEISELINFYPPRVVIEKIMRQKYFGPESIENNESSIITAPGPLKLFEKSRYSIDFGIQAGLDKYESHLPLSRQVKRFKEQGLEIKEQTLFDQIDQIAWYLKPHVTDLIHSHILSSQLAQADETWWANLKEKKKFYLWAMANEKAVSFVIYNSRSQESAENFLAGFKGVLLTDGYQCYKNFKGAELANDWAHVRRKFVKSEKSYPLESAWFIEKIKDLSLIEKKFRELPPGEMLKLRQSESKPIVEEIYEKLLNLKSQVMPEGSLGKAVSYALNLWKGLTVFLSNPSVPMTTNLIERLQRSPVVGRKNHYGSKTMRSAQVAAGWYTIIGTCEINGVNPREYIKYALTQILTKQKPLLPWDYKTMMAESAA
jgi:transposase